MKMPSENRILKRPENTSLSHLVEWWDYEVESKETPNPAFPNGVDVDASQGAIPNCTFNLPYPARRCGHYVVKCFRCGIAVICTTAGRPDDPRSLKAGCIFKPGEDINVRK